MKPRVQPKTTRWDSLLLIGSCSVFQLGTFLLKQTAALYWSLSQQTSIRRLVIFPKPFTVGVLDSMYNFLSFLVIFQVTSQPQQLKLRHLSSLLFLCEGLFLRLRQMWLALRLSRSENLDDTHRFLDGEFERAILIGTVPGTEVIHMNATERGCLTTVFLQYLCVWV